MARAKGTLKLSSNVEPQVGAPLDARSIVPTEADLYAAGSFDYSYVGMIVSVQATGDVYILKAKPTTVEGNWDKVAGGGDMSNYYTKTQINEGWYNKEQVDAIISSVYKPAGSATLATLPTLAKDVLGNVYNMTEDFTTTADFVEGAGKKYGAGSNVVVVDLGSGEYVAVTPVGDEDPSAEGWYEYDSETAKYVLSTDTEVDGTKTYYVIDTNYKFDVLPGFIDLSGYQLKFQVSELPEASEDEEGNVYQYIGASTSDYINGYFYICQEVTPETDPKTYEWVKKSVQDMGGTGELSDVLNVTKAAGGIQVGATYNAGTIFEKLWRDLLNPLEYPTFTAPSASISATGAKILEVGDTLETTITATFNRGSITPAYGTSGYRAGAAETYSLNGGTAQIGNTFTQTVNESNKSFTVTIAYAAGEQPKDSSGADYDAPLPAGTATSSALTYEFVNALWANTASIATVAKLDLVSKSAKIKEFTFTAATIENPEIFDVPADWTVTAVEVLNTLSNTWEDCSSEFSITDTVHDDAAGTETAYKRYTCNLGYAMATRQIRIKWA